MAQTWEHLLFAHWPVDGLDVPPGLELDRFDGQAWLGITPFRVSGLRLRDNDSPELATDLDPATPVIDTDTPVFIGSRLA